ncbi:MAG: hypothetical protein FJ011_24100 [Chloroflexi bacterium]|nr:hypothetical protein [Chloroflexota bacterium]
MNSKHPSMKLGLFALVITGALVAAMMLVGCIPAPQNVLVAANSLEGVWIVSVSMSGPDAPTYTAMASFHHDGSVTMMENDGRLGIGVWEKVADHRYVWTIWEYWKEGEDFLQAKVNSSLELSKGGDTYNDAVTFQAFVVGNPKPIAEGSATGAGVRMRVK